MTEFEKTTKIKTHTGIVSFDIEESKDFSAVGSVWKLINKEPLHGDIAKYTFHRIMKVTDAVVVN